MRSGVMALIVTKKSLPRGGVLRGPGGGIALPLLDGMIPAFAGTSNAAAGRPLRLGAIYAPNGMNMWDWTPKGEGGALELSPILQPLAPFEKNVVVLTGL